MSVDLATLTVRLEANIADFTSGLSQATKQLGDFSKGVQDALGEAAAALGIAFSADAAVSFTESILDGAAALEKLSQETGDTVESLSDLQAAAKITGVDDLSTALGRLAKSQADAQQGNQKAASVFQALGISISDVANLKPDQLFLKIADAMSGYADGATKSAAAQELMGRGAQNLIPLLDQGSAGFAALDDEVNQLGGQTSTAFAQASEEFESDLARLQIAAAGATQGFVAGLLPALDSTVQGFTTFIAETGHADDSLNVVGTGIKSLATAVLTIVYSIETVAADINNILGGAGTEIGVYAAAIAQALKGNFSQAHDILVEGNADLQALDAKYRADELNRDAAYSDALGKIWTDTAQQKLDAAKTASNANFDPIEALATMKPTLQLPDISALKSINDAIDAMNKKGENLDLSTGLQKTTLAATETSIAIGKYGDDLAKIGSQSAQKAADLISAAMKDDSAEASASIAKETAALQAQSDTYQKSKIDVDAYAQSHGKLGEQIGEDPAKYNAALAAYTALDKQLQTKIDATAITQIDAQIQQMTGHLVEAATANFNLQHQQLQANVTATGDTAGQAALDNLQAATIAQAKYNELQEDSLKVTQTLDDTLADIAMKQAAYQITDTQAQKQNTDARNTAITQLTAIDTQMTQIAKDSAQTALIDGAAKAQTALTQLKTQALDPLTKTINDDLVQDASSAFDDLVTGAKSASDAIGEFLDDIAKQLLELASKNLFQSFFGGTGAGSGIAGALAGLFGGGKAGGGAVNAGSLYKINENTADSEYFMPATNGTVVPASQVNGGQQIVNHFVVQTPDGRISRQSQMQISASVYQGLSMANTRNN